ncbi:hypothetical protein ACSBR1_023797 [Camellia fascicularis]
MALRFSRFSQGLAQDPTTRRIWFGIATAHDFESHDDITEKRLYQNIFASHFGQLAIIFLWTSENLFHVAWQGNFESWVQDPLHFGEGGREFDEEACAKTGAEDGEWVEVASNNKEILQRIDDKDGEGIDGCGSWVLVPSINDRGKSMENSKGGRQG